jgi:hypothetical protein
MDFVMSMLRHAMARAYAMLAYTKLQISDAGRFRGQSLWWRQPHQPHMARNEEDRAGHMVQHPA